MCVPVNLGLCLTPHNPAAALGCLWALLVGLGADGSSKGSGFEGSVPTPNTLSADLQEPAYKNPRLALWSEIKNGLGWRGLVALKIKNILD